MRNLVLLFSLLITFSSCKVELEEKVVEQFADGAPKVVEYYTKEGEKIKQKVFFNSGKLNYEGIFKDNERHGQWNSYFEDGTPWSVNNYNLGKLDGRYMLWWENGNPRITGQYKEGEKVGHWIFYNDQGVEVNVQNY